MEDFEKWYNIYCNIGLINLDELLNDEDKENLKKLGYTVDKKLYTKRDFEHWLGNIVGDYYIDFDNRDETIPRKKLEETEVTREEYNELLKKLEKINYYIDINEDVINSNKKSGTEDENFDVPYYVVEEIVDYIEQTAKGKSKSMKWENVKALIRLALINKRLSKEQAEFLISNFCRENSK